jgi:hypothetical protein
MKEPSSVTKRASLLVAGVALASTCAQMAVHSASATTRPSCHIVTDRAGDATNAPGTGRSGLPNQADVDVTSADVASNSRYVTTVVRVAHLGASLAAAPRTTAYWVFFHIGKTDYYTAATRYPDAETFTLNGGSAAEGNSQVPTPLTTYYSAVTGAFDVANDQVRVNVPMSVLLKDGPVTQGRFISGIAAETFVDAGLNAAVGAAVGGQTDISDTTDGRYRIGSPSCLMPGA